MNSENPIGADNQQGRSQGELPPQYIAGFVDGEGCFSVSIYPHPTVRYGARFQIQPCFQVYQERANVEILERIRDYFGFGSIASKGPNSTVMTLSIQSRRALLSVVIPFFEQYPLFSLKHKDFLKFKEIVLAMERKEHLSAEGFERIVRLAFSMNQRGKQRKYTLEELLAEPSETACRAAND